MKILRNTLWGILSANYILPVMLYFFAPHLCIRYIYYVIGIVGAAGFITTISLIVYRAVKGFKFEKNIIFLCLLFLICILLQVWLLMAVWWLEQNITWV